MRCDIVVVPQIEGELHCGAISLAEERLDVGSEAEGESVIHPPLYDWVVRRTSQQEYAEPREPSDQVTTPIAIVPR